MLSYFVNDPRKWILFCPLIGGVGYFAYKNTRDNFVQSDYTKALNKYFKKFQSKKMTAMVLLMIVLISFRVIYQITFIRRNLNLGMGISIIDIGFAFLLVSCLSLNFYMSIRFPIELKDIEKKEKNLLEKHIK